MAKINIQNLEKYQEAHQPKKKKFKTRKKFKDDDHPYKKKNKKHKKCKQFHDKGSYCTFGEACWFQHDVRTIAEITKNSFYQK